MDWYGKEIYCTRGETFSLDCSIVNRDGTPYRISTELSNAFFLLTVASTKYSQENRYVLHYWINLADFPKVEDMTILDVDALPTGDDVVLHRLLRFENKYYVYSEDEYKYVEYGARLIHRFDSTTTKDWIDKTYEYDLKLVSGSLKNDYLQALNKGQLYDKSPFEYITFETQIIPKTKMYVEVNNGGEIYE